VSGSDGERWRGEAKGPSELPLQENGKSIRAKLTYDGPLISYLIYGSSDLPS
jgi:hypothetical protein